MINYSQSNSFVAETSYPIVVFGFGKTNEEAAKDLLHNIQTEIGLLEEKIALYRKAEAEAKEEIISNIPFSY